MYKRIRSLPRNVWAVGFTSLFMDISSEMVTNILPLFLANALGVQTSMIGLIEGVAESMASLLKMASGWFSDKFQGRKWIAVSGYGLSALTKPFFLIANSWGLVAGVRWTDRVGKGIRTAPRDALIADSVQPEQRGIAFGLHRAMDTIGAMIGILIAAWVIYHRQGNSFTLSRETFHNVVLFSLIPAFLAVIALAFGAKEVAKRNKEESKKTRIKELGIPFFIFLGIVAIFTLGNSADAFLILRAQDAGMSVLGILGMLAAFNLIYSLISVPAGSLSDKVGRKKLIIGGWMVYALIYFGFALINTANQMFLLYAIYGVYYGLAHGAGNALIADLVPTELRGTAYGAYNAVVGLMAFPASYIAGYLWQIYGAPTPFWFGGGMALLAVLGMVLFRFRDINNTRSHQAL